MQAVDFVIAGDVVMSIHDPKLSEELAPLDTDGDFIVALNDFNEDLDIWSYAKAPALDRFAFNEAVTDAFVNTGTIEPGQKQAVLSFIDQYHNSLKFKSIINKWRNVHVDKKGNVLKLDATDWFFYVLRYMNEGEPLVAKNIPNHGEMLGHEFNIELSQMIFDLTETEFADDDQLVFGNLNGPYNRAMSDQVYKIFYDETKIPDILRPAWHEFLAMHEGARVFLEEYRDIECNGNCPQEKHFVISNPPEIAPSTQTMLLKTKVEVVTPFDKIKEMLEE